MIMEETKSIKKPLRNVLWISYDLGSDGDYDGIYTFLGKYEAVECGDSVARISNYVF